MYSLNMQVVHVTNHYNYQFIYSTDFMLLITPMHVLC
jgi:hypothetical protein